MGVSIAHYFIGNSFHERERERDLDIYGYKYPKYLVLYLLLLLHLHTENLNTHYISAYIYVSSGSVPRFGLPKPCLILVAYLLLNIKKKDINVNNKKNYAK